MKLPLIVWIFLYATKSAFCTPSSCVKTNSNVDDLIKCLSEFIAKENSISDADWNSTQPSVEQRDDWHALIMQILQSDRNCDAIQMPSSLQDVYELTLFNDTLATYCLLYETTVVGERFAKGWGIFMTPYDKSAQSGVHLNLHVSAAHPFTDEYVQNQAANIFVKTNAVSLIISGVEREASTVNSTCEPSDGYRTDGAHDNNTMFHSANYAIMSYQQIKGCGHSICIFIQFHGKADSTCPQDSIFLSNGFSQSSSNYYNNSELPIQRLKTYLRSNMINFTVNTPSDSSCDLTAGSNVFSRLLNGVAYGQECSVEPMPGNSTRGYFIHAEQFITMRTPPYYDSWALSLIQTFESYGITEDSNSSRVYCLHFLMIIFGVFVSMIF